MACLAAAFVARFVLLRLVGEEALVGSQVVSLDGLVAVILRDVVPHRLQHQVASVADREAQNLPDQARNGCPNPQRGRHAHTDLVDLNDIAFGCWNLCQHPVRLYGDCLFFRTARIVSRLTFSARAIPRCDVRSASNPTMASFVAGVTARLLAAGVNTFLHPLHRNFWLPQRFVPKRITNAKLSQTGHTISEMPTIHTVYGNNAGKSNAIGLLLQGQNETQCVSNW